MNQLSGKKGLVMGVANERSIAWGIAKALHEAGAELAFTYQGEGFGKRLEPLAESVGSTCMLDVDVTDDASLDHAFDYLSTHWGNLDFLVHALAFSDKTELTGRFINTSRANFKNSLDISAYSLIDVARRAYPMMKDNGGSIITVTFQGSNPNSDGGRTQTRTQMGFDVAADLWVSSLSCRAQAWVRFLLSF